MSGGGGSSGVGPGPGSDGSSGGTGTSGGGGSGVAVGVGSGVVVGSGVTVGSGVAVGSGEGSGVTVVSGEGVGVGVGPGPGPSGSPGGLDSTGPSGAGGVTVLPDALFGAVSQVEHGVNLLFVVETPAPGQPAAMRVSAVLLDGVQDPGNVGSILRSAGAAGITQVFCSPGTAFCWSPKVLRAGMGAHFGLHLAESCALEALDALALPLVATSSHAQGALHEVDLPWPCAWVMGHEGQGVSAGLMSRCMLALRIPQPGGEESLNVAAAAAVCLYESARQRS